jgi:sugar lactone lactonase YvrE
MGTQSIPHPPRFVRAPIRIALLLLLCCPSFHTASAQISALTAPLILPSAIVFDATGNLYLAETGNHVIRKVDTAGNITTIAGTGTQGFSGDTGPATSATLDSPQGLALDTLDTPNNLYIADTHNHRIRKLNLATGIITTIAGTGTPGFSPDQTPAASARLNLPTALALDTKNNLYVADTGNHRIRKISAGLITTVAGTGTQGFSGDAGPAIFAAIDSPTGLALDTANNLYLADTHNNRIRRIDATTGIVTTIAGAGAPGFSGDTAPATAAALALPHGLALDAAGNLYLADTQNHRIRRIDARTGIITTVAGDGTQAFSGDGGPAIAASLDSPRSTVISFSALITLADTGNQRIRQLTAAPAPPTTIQTIAGPAPTTSETLTLTAPAIIPYGTGQLTATLAAPATGAITFVDTTPAGTTGLGTSSLASSIAIFSTATLPAGLHNLTAAYAGDSTHTAAQSSTFALTVSPQQLTAPIAPIALVYGQAIPAINATLTGVLPKDAANLSATFTTTATSLSPVGSYPITATLTGPAAGNYTVASPIATLTINPAPTLITLDNLAATAAIGSSITLTAHVAATTGTPTGSITLLDNGNPISTSPLSPSGDAVFTIAALTAGSHSFTALYNGNANFALSASIPQFITIGTGGPTTNPDFALASTGTTTQTILSGSSANYTFSAQLLGNMSSPIALAATGLPNLATASFNPPTLPPGSAANTFTLTIATPTPPR